MNRRNVWQTFLQDAFLKYCRFFIPEESRILMIGCRNADFLKKLRPLVGVGVDIAVDGDFQADNQKSDIAVYHVTELESFLVEEIFDYVIINDVLASIYDVRAFLRRMQKMAAPETRIIINSYNPDWAFLIDRMNIRRAAGAGEQTRLHHYSRRELEKFLTISGYETIKKENYTLFPYQAPFWSALVNRFFAKLPLLKKCCLGYITVARVNRPAESIRDTSVSVVLTCRDEEGNIEGLVERIPAMGKKTEIVFVEGHSVDNTVDKIREMIQKHPDKDIKLYHQTGIGQGDAFRMGFDRAEGDFLIWLEADLTTPPEEARYIWEAYAEGHGEYINGSRFVYPMAPGAMPLLNNLGNRFFSRAMSAVTGQRFTDTLCGFKGIPRNRYIKILNNPNRFDDLDPFGDFLLILGAVKNNLKMMEVPVHYQPRQYGEPKAYGRSWSGLLAHARVLLQICRQAFIDFRLI